MFTQKITLLALFLSISLTGCHSVMGNIIPDTGPTMESIYDDLSDPAITGSAITDARNMRVPSVTSPNAQIAEKNKKTGFVKLPNPELPLYIFPHLAGSEQLPIPGYWTSFSAYSRTMYALPLTVKSKENPV